MVPVNNEPSNQVDQGVDGDAMLGMLDLIVDNQVQLEAEETLK